MSTNCRRLHQPDQAVVNELVQVNIDAKTGVVGGLPFVHSGIPEMMAKPGVYQSHVILGCFRDGKLQVVSVLNPLDDKRYFFQFILSDPRLIKPITGLGGVNTDNQDLYRYGCRFMEEHGYYIFYSIRPTRGHFNRMTRNLFGTEHIGNYIHEVLEEVPAGALPKSTLGRMIAHHIKFQPMSLVQYRRVGGRLVA